MCNPKEMSQSELERLSRVYIKALCKIIGPDRNVPAPDVYTNAQTMARMMDKYSRIAGKTIFSVVTGKLSVSEDLKEEMIRQLREGGISLQKQPKKSVSH